MDPQTPATPPAATPDTATPASSPHPPVGPPPAPAKKSRDPLKTLLLVIGFFILCFVGWAILGAMPDSSDDSKSSSATRSNKQQITVAKSAPVTAANSVVKSTCYNYSLPQGYELQTESAACVSAVNVSGGDALTLIQVQAVTDTGTVEQGIEKIKKAFVAENLTFVESSAAKLGTLEAGKISFKDPDGLLRLFYYIPDPRPHFLINGKLVGSYTIDAYAYNADLMKAVEAVAQSFTIAK